MLYLINELKMHLQGQNGGTSEVCSKHFYTALNIGMHLFFKITTMMLDMLQISGYYVMIIDFYGFNGNSNSA